MTCGRSTAPSVFVLLVLLVLLVRSVDSTRARSVSSPAGFEPPEIDGSAVDSCGIFFVPTPEPETTTITTTTTTTTTTTPIIEKQVVVTTRQPAVQSPPRKPEAKISGTPIRPQPALAGPISDRLLYYLLANSRRRAAGSPPRSNSLIAQPMGGHGATSSDSDESAAATLTERAGRTKDGSSEDSSDET